MSGSSAPIKKRIKSYVTAEASVDVEIDEFDDEVILERAREILAERAKTGTALGEDAIDFGISPTWLAQRALQAHIEKNESAFNEISRELVGEITGRIL